MGIKLISQDFHFMNPQWLCLVIAWSLKYLLIASDLISQASSQNTCLLYSFISVELLSMLFLCCCLLHPISDIAEPFTGSGKKYIFLSLQTSQCPLYTLHSDRFLLFFLQIYLAFPKKPKTQNTHWKYMWIKIHCEQDGNKANNFINKHQISIIICDLHYYFKMVI